MWILTLGLAGMFVTALGCIVFSGGWVLMALSTQAPASLQGAIALIILFGGIVGALFGGFVEYTKAESERERKYYLYFILITILCVLSAFYYKQLNNSHHQRVEGQKRVVVSKTGMVIDNDTGQPGYGFARKIDNRKTEVSLAIDKEGNFYIYEAYGIFALTVGSFSAPVLKFDPQGRLDRDFSLRLMAGMSPNERQKGVIIHMLKDDLILLDRGYVAMLNGMIIHEFTPQGLQGQVSVEWKDRLLPEPQQQINSNVRARIEALGGYQPLVVLPDGGVVMAGNFVVEDHNYRSFGIVKILPSGMIDTSFLVEDSKS